MDFLLFLDKQFVGRRKKGEMKNLKEEGTREK
jgi:hypothetical protein